jgi:2-oxoisovalerate dehydrogenase E1 component
MSSKITENLYRKALLIRKTEDAFLDLFTKGDLNGTVHTCNGQEFSALAFIEPLQKGDSIYSNHRCHGHYIAHTNDVKGLIGELMGKASGVCGGIGSSQHLCGDNFYSNGIQGGIVPIAVGMALANKFQNNNKVVLVFIGDGTLGEGVVYESMNLAALLDIPLHIVCENNMYAQSTKLSQNLAGTILGRPEAFGIKTFHSNTWELDNLFNNAEDSIAYARKGLPVFHLVDTYRLNHHSKSDDKRDEKEVARFTKKDPLNLYRNKNKESYDLLLSEINGKISQYIDECRGERELDPSRYTSPLKKKPLSDYIPLNNINERVVTRINLFFHETIGVDKKLIFIGEDVLSPYGGAFKVADNLSKKYPKNVISTPISEGAITGMANGLALSGFRPYLEIMFGDFITLALDQIINHASKFHHMYNKQVTCPIVIRTPMGGGRGYGPTHSQTMDKFLVGIDNVTVIALNSLIDPLLIYRNIHENEEHPVLVIENKVDYGRFVGMTKVNYYSLSQSRDLYPTVRCSPNIDQPSLTLVSYGGISQDVIDNIHGIFKKTDLIPEVIVLSQISPLNIGHILDSVNNTRRIVVIEEGGKEFGIGAEIIAQVVESASVEIIIARRIGALAVPVPSSQSLEDYVLPNTTLVDDIYREVS